jgi:hypothetical protein
MIRRALLVAGMAALLALSSCKIGEGGFSISGKYSEKTPGSHVKRVHLHGKGEIKPGPNGVEITGTDKDTDIELVDEVVGPGGESALDIAGVGSVTVSPGPR